MPILRHECGSCGRELTDLYQPRDPKPYCCGRKMRLLMPTHVVGRVKPDSNGVHTGSGFASAGSVAASTKDQVLASASAMPSSLPVKPRDPEDPYAIPLPTETRKDYELCSAAERDDRWRDATERLTTWQTNCLEAGGVEPAEARRTATETQQQVTERARTENVRDDGLT